MSKKSKSLLVLELMARKASGDKKSRSRSCLLCQKRKQKCDHRMPLCTTCIKAGVQCIQPEKYSVESPVKDEYTVVLEKRILYLESMIDEDNAYKANLFAKYRKLSPFIEHHDTDELMFSSIPEAVTNAANSATAASSPSSVTPVNSIISNGAELSSTSAGAPLVRTNTFDPGHSHEDGSGSLEIPTFSLINDPMRQIPKLDSNGKPLLVSSDSKASMTPPPPPSAVSTAAKNSTLTGTRIPALDSFSPHLSIAGSVDLSKTILGKYDLKEFISIDPEFDVEDTLSRALIDTHFIRFQYKFPFLDEKEIVDFHSAYAFKNLSGYMNDMNYFYFACCRMWLIYSLNSFILKTTGDYKHLEPLRLFSTALRFLSKCQIKDPYKQIEIYLLTILCLIRCDRDSIELYRIVGDAMKVAVSLGLHKYSLYLNCSNEERIKKMKCFWCVYLLDRLISVSIGKSFTFPEKEIDSDLPLFDEDPSVTIVMKDFDNNSSPLIKREKILFINQTIKLKRIEAKAIESLNIVGSNTEYSTKSELPLVEHYFDLLQNWRKECTVITKEVEKATLGLYYFRTVRVLIQPYLELMQPEDRLLKECQAAAGQICQLFKVFHQKTVYGHSTLAINNVFVAGVTLIYCLWLIRNTEDKRRKLLGDTAKHTRPVMTATLFTSLDDLKACSICLFVMAERSKYAVVFRDTFDQLLRATIGNLIERCGPDSTELVYNHHTTNRYRSNKSISGDIAGNGNAIGSNSQSGISSKGTEISEEMPPAVVRRPVSHYEILPDYFKDKQATGYKQEQEENKRKRGVLEKSAVPKSLSHLLISEEDEENTSSPKQSPANAQNNALTGIAQNNGNFGGDAKNGTQSLASKNDNTYSSFASGQFFGDLFNMNVENNNNSSNNNFINNNSPNNNGGLVGNITGANLNTLNEPKFFASQSLFNPSNIKENNLVGGSLHNNSNNVSGNHLNINAQRAKSNGFNTNGSNLALNNDPTNPNVTRNNNTSLSNEANSIPFTDRANDMINNISTWTEASGPITASYAINNFLPYDFLAKDPAGQVAANQVYADLDALNSMMNAENNNNERSKSSNDANGSNNNTIVNKKRKFDTRSLFNGKFNEEIASTTSAVDSNTNNANITGTSTSTPTSAGTPNSSMVGNLNYANGVNVSGGNAMNVKKESEEAANNLIGWNQNQPNNNNSGQPNRGVGPSEDMWGSNNTKHYFLS